MNADQSDHESSPTAGPDSGPTPVPATAGSVCDPAMGIPQAIDPATARHRVRQAAVDAAVAVAADHGVVCREPVVLNDLFSVTVHLAPAPVVARVPTWIRQLRPDIEVALQREVGVTGYLAAAGAPVVAPSRELPPGPHRRGGHIITFATYQQPDLDRTITAADCAVMLSDLHQALCSYPGEVPPLGRSIAPLSRWNAHLERWSRELTGLDTQRLSQEVARLAESLAETPQDQILHGDAHPGNLLPTADGPVWIDFEDVCRGPALWDLVTVGDLDLGFISDTYRAEARQLQNVRTAQIALGLLGLRKAFADLDGWDDTIRQLAASLHGEQSTGPRATL